MRTRCDKPACSACVRASGLWSRLQRANNPERPAIAAPTLLAMLSKPMRVHPRPGRTLDRRANIEARLRRAGIVARQYALKEHEKWLTKR
jgi:hypothetical protein